MVRAARIVVYNEKKTALDNRRKLKKKTSTFK